MDQEQKPHERSFIRDLVPDWRPTREQVLRTLRIAIVLVVVLGLLTLIGLPFGITLWEWVKLLVVPVVIAGGGIWFNRQQRDRELRNAEQRAQDEALQAYLDQMSGLLADKDRPLHRAQVGDSLSTIARARTLTVLPRLDGARKGSVLQFLSEAGLVRKVGLVTEAGRGTYHTYDRVFHLDRADLSKVVLYWASLQGARLREANLSRAELYRANLIEAHLSKATLNGANLSEAELGGADLRGAKLRGADLYGTDLSGADLSEAYVEQNQLVECAISQGLSKETVMPNGQKIKDWLEEDEEDEEDRDLLKGAIRDSLKAQEDRWLQRSKGRGEEGETTDPS